MGNWETLVLVSRLGLKIGSYTVRSGAPIGILQEQHDIFLKQIRDTCASKEDHPCYRLKVSINICR